MPSGSRKDQGVCRAFSSTRYRKDIRNAQIVSEAHSYQDEDCCLVNPSADNQSNHNVAAYTNQPLGKLQ